MPGFNEAAGIPRGRRRHAAVRDWPRGASMRPRVFPAEDDQRRSEPGRHMLGFNEAAGIPRGRRVRREGAAAPLGGFNEAAGIPRGRHAVPDRGRLPQHRFNEAAGIPRGRRHACIGRQPQIPLASMRPRVFPAEDTRRPGGGLPASGASMRPRVPPGKAGYPLCFRRQPADSASMRPRVFPAEDADEPREGRNGESSFNEAAGIPRGRHRDRRA